MRVEIIALLLAFNVVQTSTLQKALESLLHGVSCVFRRDEDEEPDPEIVWDEKSMGCHRHCHNAHYAFLRMSLMRRTSGTPKKGRRLNEGGKASATMLRLLATTFRNETCWSSGRVMFLGIT